MITSKFWSRASVYVENYCLGVTHQSPLITRDTFYRAMHFSAKHGLAIACCPSVCLSVCDVGDLWLHRLEILETNCTDNYSQTPSLFVAKRRSTYSQGNMGKFWGAGRLVVGYVKSGENKSGNISATCKDIGKVTMYGIQELTKALSSGTTPARLLRPRASPPLVWA